MSSEQTIELRIRDLLLMALTISSGAVDAISYLALGKIFTAFMTGNVVFLGFQTTGAGGPSVVSLAIALVFFALGAFLATWIAKPSKGSGVWPRRVTVALGIITVAQAVFLAVWMVSDGLPSSDVANVLIGVWALAMGMQTATVFSLSVPGVFTTAATATLTILMSNIASLPRSTIERQRLAGVLVSLLAGATAGSLLLVHVRTYAPILPLGITILVVATAAIAPWAHNASDDRERQ